MDQLTPEPGLMMIFLIAYIGLVLLFIICTWRIFSKAGKSGWASIVPIYNIIIILEIAGKPWWWLLMMLIPFVNIVFAVWMTNLLSKSFGKGEGFTLGLIFLPFIFFPILAFGNISYIGPGGKPLQQVELI